MGLDISEYIDTSHGNLVEPPCAVQSVEIGPEPTESKPFNKLTRCVRLSADQDCRLTLSSGARVFLRAGKVERRVVPPGDGFKVSVVAANPDGRSASGTVDGLIALITDPKAAAKRKAELEKLQAKVDRKTTSLRQAEALLADKLATHNAAAAELAKQQTEFAAFFTEHDGDLTRRENDLTFAKTAFEAQTGEHVATMERRERDVTRREDAMVAREVELQKQERLIAELKADLERRLGHIKAATS